MYQSEVSTLRVFKCVFWNMTVYVVALSKRLGMLDAPRYYENLL